MVALSNEILVTVETPGEINDIEYNETLIQKLGDFSSLLCLLPNMLGSLHFNKGKSNKEPPCAIRLRFIMICYISIYYSIIKELRSI